MHRVGLILPQDFQLLSLAPMTAFEMTAFALVRPPPVNPIYDLHLLSEHGGPVRSSSSLTVETKAFGDPAFDTIIVGATTEHEMVRSTAGLISFVQAAAEASRRTASFCNGAFVLAEAGLLDGRRATTHWVQVASFRARFPQVRMEAERIYINDGPIWTSAGMSAGIDLALAMIDDDLGSAVAKSVARLMVMTQRRMGGEQQSSALLDMMPRSDRIQSVVAHIRQNLRSTLSVEELAAVAHLSPRQFSRAFVAETGQSPAAAVARIRLEAARFMIEEGRHSANVVAQETGFADRERMRRAFIRTFGLPPQSLRRSARLEAKGAP